LLAISAGANPKAVQTMLGHKSAVLTLDTYADLFPDDQELVSSALDRRRQAALEFTADHLRTATRKVTTKTTGQTLSPAMTRVGGGGIRTHDLFVPNDTTSGFGDDDGV
jgi:hypothetical protein